MAKTRIYELARELGLESKDVLEQAQSLGLEVKTASSGLDDSDAQSVRAALGGPGPPSDVATRPEPEEKSADPIQEVEPASPEQVSPEPVSPESVSPEKMPDATTTDDATDAGPAETVQPEKDAIDADTDVGLVSIVPGVTVAEFAEAIGLSASEVVKELMTRGVPAGANAGMPEALMEEVGESFGFIVDIAEPPEESGSPAGKLKEALTFDDPEESLEPRPPVVTVMGHVDHGKTTLLDTIRKANVVADEHGGITQHVGAYQVSVGGNKLTFIDTPGHEAFTTMRARGADVTDIVVLVVAADDAVMPQTIEAISHAKAAGVQLVIAINKVDLPGSDPFRVRTMLTEHDVLTEELGGDVPSVEISALTGEGVDNLLEVIDLIAQLQEYRANPKAPATGVVIESQLDPGMGPTATVIIKRGTLQRSDSFVAGPVAGRVRAMLDHENERMSSAGPSTPVLIMGWADVPTAGDILEVVSNDREARALADGRADTAKLEDQETLSGRDRLKSLLDKLRSEETELRVVLKADTNGSLEAIRDAVTKITREDASIDVVHGAVGGISENDITLAEVTGAVVIGFNVRPDSKARRAAETQGIEIRTYFVIYELLEELEAMLVGSLAPDTEEVVLGAAEVRAIFKVPRAGTIAGSYVTEGVMQRNANARLLRNGVVVYTGTISSLRRFKDDVREVATGFECGIGLENFNDVKEGDVVEAYSTREVPRT